MKKKSKAKMTVAEAAQDLAALAAELGKGNLLLQGEKIAVTEPARMVIKEKLKDGELNVRINITAQLQGYEAGSRQAAQEEPSRVPAPAKQPKTGKGVKKELARLWKKVSLAIKKQTVIEPETAAAITRLCELFTLQTKPAWEKEWRQCSDMIKQSISAADSSDYPRASQLVGQVNELLKSCHKQHK